MNKLGNVEKFWMGFLVDLSHIKEGLLGYTSQSSQKISTKNMEYSLI